MIDKLFTFTDKNNNAFICRKGNIFLRPNNTSQERKIGIVYATKQGSLVYKKYENEKDIYRKTNSWSIPVAIYNKVDRIWFHTAINDYKIIVAEMVNNTHYFHFAKTGTEKKVYIPLKYWKIRKKLK